MLREALPLALAALEVAWLYPWLLLVSGAFYGDGPLLGPMAVFLMLGGGFITVRVALSRPWRLQMARVVVVGAGAIAGLGVVRAAYFPRAAAYDLRWIAALLRSAHDALPAVLPPAMAALAATVLWWRGVALGEREFTHLEAERGFRRGVAWTVAFVLLSALYGRSRAFAAAAAAPGFLLAFFALGLFLLAVTRLLAIWQETRPDPTQALAANRHWVLLLVGVVGAILSGATLVAGLLNFPLRPVALQWLRPLAPVVEYIFLALFAVALVIARLIIAVLSRLPFQPRALEPPAMVRQPLGSLLRELPPHVVSGARWGVVLLVIALLVLLIAIAVVRGRRRSPRPGEDEHESVWDRRSVLSGLGAAWRAVWRRAAPAARQEPAVSAIRALYREALLVGRRLGVPRQPDETPYEYRPRLGGRLARAALPIAALTEAYVRVRYARHQPDATEIAQAEADLQEIRAAAAAGEPPERSGGG
ncbi:MAG TPA: DUF4129 domain-containing protein [bacterium]|nr:DUF4129 domain-containing protein [bacterium]